MPKFLITKCVDAFVNYQAIVDATDAADARRIAEEEDGINWRESGVSEFDETDYDNIEPELWETDPEVIRKKLDEAIAKLPKPTMPAAEHLALINEMRGRTPEGFHDLRVDDAEHATILAALRFYQEQGMGELANRSDAIHDIATNGDAVISLDAGAIDDLCERINV